MFRCIDLLRANPTKWSNTQTIRRQQLRKRRVLGKEHRPGQVYIKPFLANAFIL